MTYVITETNDVQFEQTVCLMKSGNEYAVMFHAGEDGATKHFSNLQDAMEVYMKFVEAFSFGYYNVETRKSWLA